MEFQSLGSLDIHFEEYVEPLTQKTPSVPLSRGPGHRKSNGYNYPPRCEPKKRSCGACVGAIHAPSVGESKQGNRNTMVSKSFSTFELLEVDSNGIEETRHEERIKSDCNAQGSAKPFGRSKPIPPACGSTSSVMHDLQGSGKPSSSKGNEGSYNQSSSQVNNNLSNSSLSFITCGEVASSSPAKRFHSLQLTCSNHGTRLVERELDEWCKEVCHFYDLSNVKRTLERLRETFLRFEAAEEEAQKVNYELSQELFHLRDAHIRKWRTTVLGDVVPFRCDPPRSSDKAHRKSLDHAYFARKNKDKHLVLEQSDLKCLRSNTVLMEALEGPQQQWMRSALRKLFSGATQKNMEEKEGSTDLLRICSCANYTEAEWSKEKKQIEKEIEMWKIKNNELQHNVKRGTHIKNISSLKPVSAHDPRERKKEKMVVSAPDPSGRDVVAELRLDLKKEETACERLSERLNLAEEAIRKRQERRLA